MLEGSKGELVGLRRGTLHFTSLHREAETENPVRRRRRWPSPTRENRSCSHRGRSKEAVRLLWVIVDVESMFGWVSFLWHNHPSHYYYFVVIALDFCNPRFGLGKMLKFQS
jgi:hypothetical protein